MANCHNPDGKTVDFMQKKEFLITVRGTAEVEDVITDLTALPTVRELSVASKPPRQL